MGCRSLAELVAVIGSAPPAGSKHLRRAKAVSAAGAVALCVAGGAAAETCGPGKGVPDSLKYVQYFLSRPQDAAGCAMTVVNGRLAVQAPVTNPALTCPDMFAWKLFAEAVAAEFWKTWATDQETWPGNGLPSDPGRPLALCAPGQTGPNCCNPDSATNPGYDDPAYKAKWCPYFPGDHASTPAQGLPERVGVLPSKAHMLSFAGSPRVREILLQDVHVRRLMTEHSGQTEGRKIRQAMAELVFRNKSLFDYVFRNELYHQEGLLKVVARNDDNIASAAPYRLSNDRGAVAEIVFPADAVMIKTNWLARERAEEMGVHDDPEHPYVKMNITSPVTDNNGTILKPGEHWLVAFHISSKDIPNWVWATFEHVNNPGRCDYTGCNDSYGYGSRDRVAAGQASNYTRPHEVCDDLPLPSWVLDPGKTYPAGVRRAPLDAVFRALRIGTRENTTLVPTPEDRAWLSYELKGSQVEFTDSMGRAVHAGNSVTEAGFVSTSSCMTCHARASVASDGAKPPALRLPALGVFENVLTDSGYLPSSLGLPVADWFNRNAQPPSLLALQTDFVWGFLAANSSKPPAGPGVISARTTQPGAGAFFSLRERILGE